MEKHTFHLFQLLDSIIMRVCDSVFHHSYTVCCCLTVREARRVVVDVGEGDVNHSASSEASSLSSHVFGFDHHLVVFPLLTVHVTRTQGRPDHA